MQKRNTDEKTFFIRRSDIGKETNAGNNQGGSDRVIFGEERTVEDAEVGAAVIRMGLRCAASDARGNAQGSCSGADAGLDVGVLAVARHEEFGGLQAEAFHHHPEQIGRASCRERVWLLV